MMQMENFLQQGSGSEFSPDLDLIEVLWRQDVDLGVGKEVFDPNLRKELEQERELELRKEQEKRKEAERREQERQQQAQQWLSQNFIRDGETGELMPIAGNNSINSTSGPSLNSNLYSDYTFSVTLEEALSCLEAEENHSYGQPPLQQPQQQQQQQQQPPVASSTSAAGGQLPFVADELAYLTAGLAEEAPACNTTGQTDDEHFEQSWKEVVEHITTTTTTTTNPPASSTSSSSSSSLPPHLVAEDQSFFFQPVTVAQPPAPEAVPYSGDSNNYYHHQYPPPPPAPTAPQQQQQLQQPYLPPPTTPQQQQQTHLPPPPPPTPQQQQLPATHANASMDYLLPGQSNQSESAVSMESVSMLHQHRLMRENSTELGGALHGLLQNVTLPLLSMDDMAGVLNVQPLGDADVTTEFNMNADPAGDILSQFDLDRSNLLFPNASDLQAINSTNFLNSSELMTELLPVDNLEMTVMGEAAGQGLLQSLDETQSDSAISMGSSSPEQEVNETMQMSPFDGLEGATGGSEYDSSSYGHHRSHMHSTGSAEENYQYSCSSYGSPASVSTNCSTGSNDTEHSSGHSSAALHHIHHNHTYPTQPGQTPREVKKYAKRDGPRQKGPQSRDMKRAEDLKLPIPFEQIVGCPVEEFNDLITKTKLTEAQMALMRDIRRRGKNKVAAQNCRKRKLDVLVNLEEEMSDTQLMRDKLAEERRRLDLATRQAKERYSALYDVIFNSLRDEDGRPYDPAEYTLQESSDGNVFLVRKATGSAVSSSSSLSYPPSSGGSSSSSSSSSGRKGGGDSRKPSDPKLSQKKRRRE